MAARQLVLDLAHRPALGRGDFLVAPSNAAAVAWIDRWPDWPGPGLALHGPAGAGKSHLAAVWRARSDAVVVTPADLAAGRIEAMHCVIEEGETAFADPGRAEAVFHLYNRLAARGGHLLLTGRQPPSRWPVSLADLGSRLRVLPAVEIGAPDDTMLAGLFVKLFGDRQLVVPGELILYLVSRIERSCAAVARTVEILDRASLAERRPITLPLARQVLGLV
ncbi:MAG: DNA replication protein [Rhodospirillaceae bacterium]|nr:DNA replication protein [Rhodospirillaceae bacterium]